MAYYGEASLILVMENKTFCDYAFELFCVRQKKKQIFVSIVKKKRNRQIILHLSNMNKQEAVTKRCFISRWSIIYYNLRYDWNFTKNSSKDTTKVNIHLKETIHKGFTGFFKTLLFRTPMVGCFRLMKEVIKAIQF